MTSEPESLPADSTQVPVSDEVHPRRTNAIARLVGLGRTQWRSIVVAALVIAAVAFAGGLFIFQYRPDRQVDDSAGRHAVQAASDGTVAALSYSPDSMARDIANAKSRLTGKFLAYYEKFTKDIVTPLSEQKRVTQTVTVVRAAVSELHPDSAVVLMFLNETATSKDKPQALTVPSSVRVTLMKVGDSWLISNLDPLV